MNNSDFQVLYQLAAKPRNGSVLHRDGPGKNVVLDVPVQRTRVYDIHLPSQAVFQVLDEAGAVKQTATLFQRDQKIDVAVVARVAARHGIEDAHVFGRGCCRRSGGAPREQ